MRHRTAAAFTVFLDKPKAVDAESATQMLQGMGGMANDAAQAAAAASAAGTTPAREPEDPMAAILRAAEQEKLKKP
jgi:hypothetical protein